MATEAELIAALSTIFSEHPGPGVEIGIGDDGAVLLPPSTKQIAVADMAVEGVHFRRDWSSLTQIGAKITTANVADILAMGAKPTYLLVTAGLPADFSVAEMIELAQGIRNEADRVGATVVGGDLSVSPVMVISIMALGESESPILRSGAKVGDMVFVSALPGWSAAGLACLTAGASDAKAVAAHLKPTVDYALARQLAAAGINSLCDISDGLISEAHHLSDASQVRFVLEPDFLSASPEFAELSVLALKLGTDVWRWICGGGEDHLFLGTTSDPSVLPSEVMVIGRVVSGRGVELVGKSEFEKVGYSHFQAVVSELPFRP